MSTDMQPKLLPRLSVRLITQFAAGVALSSSLALAQTPTPLQRIQAATAASSLDTLTTRPWHAKLTVTLFDDKGKNPVDGTIEYWKSGEDSLRVITVGSRTETLLSHNGKSFHGIDGASLPSLAEEIFDHFIHPGPTAGELASSMPELRPLKSGNVSLDCVMLSQKLNGAGVIPLGLFPTYCLDHGADHLRAAYDFGSHQLTINRSGRFLDQDVPIELSLSDATAVVATAKTVTMATFTPTPETFLPTPTLTAGPTGNRGDIIPAGIMQGQILTRPQPVYPVEARVNHIEGRVELRAVIDREGHIRTLHVKSAPDPILAVAAIAAVRQWTYKPYLLNGEPTEVDTTVVVNFNIN